MSEPDSDPGSTGRSPRRSAPLLWLCFWCAALTGALPYLFAREAMNPSLAAAVLAHVASGILLLLGLRRFASTWARGAAEGAGFVRREGWTHRLGTHGVPLLLIVVGLTGALLFGAAALGRSIGPWRGTYIAHVASGLAVAALVLLSTGITAARRVRPRRVGPASPALATAVILALSCGALAASHYAAESYFTQLTAATPAQARNPLFPAGTRIARTADWNSASDVASCGDAGCHPQIVRDWHSSPHARSTHSAEYRSSLAEASRRLGPDGARWCTGCHAPLSLAANPRGSGKPSDSVDCLSCHAMSRMQEPVGNGHALYSPPPLYPFARPKSPGERWLRGFLLRVRPAPHRAGMAGPPEDRFGSAMCAPCHRLSVNAPQNGYKFLPYDETWTEWQTGPYSGESAHVFQTAKQASCADCHLRSVSGASAGPIHNHAGGRAALEFYKHNVNHLADAMRVEIIALRRETGPGQPPQIHAPLAQVPVMLAAGETATIDVVVENRGMGHSFTGSLHAGRRAWLDVRASARQDVRKIGGQGNGAAHGYGLWALNRDGQLGSRDNFYTMVAPILVRAIPAGEADVARFRFKVPHRARSIRLTARLLSEVGGSASARPSVLASDLVQFAVNQPGESGESGRSGGSGVPALSRAVAADAPRFFAYGVGLLRPNAGPMELAQARAAFREALRLQPNNPDYLVALGRAYLADADLLSARAQLEQALKLDRRSPRARAWLGNTLLRMGQLEPALAILNPLSREYPRDGALWIDIGLCHLKSARYEPASEAFARALEVDPNDSTAHYNLMRCYTAMNRLTDARREEAVFRALQDDEPLTNLVEPFLQAHPSLRRETLGMHEHSLEVSR